MKHGATLECKWLTTDEADGQSKEERWKCGGRWGDWHDRHSNVLTSVHLAREEGRGPYLDGGGREWQRREINLRFVLINLPKLALFRGEEGGPDEQTQAGAPPGFLGKVATPGVQEHGEGEEWKRKKTQARLGRVLSQLPLSVCSAFAQRKSKIPRVQELSFSAKKTKSRKKTTFYFARS